MSNVEFLYDFFCFSRHNLLLDELGDVKFPFRAGGVLD